MDETIADHSTIDMDEQRKARIDEWLKQRWDSGDYFDSDLPTVLLEFEKFLGECEARRMRE